MALRQPNAPRSPHDEPKFEAVYKHPVLEQTPPVARYKKLPSGALQEVKIGALIDLTSKARISYLSQR